MNSKPSPRPDKGPAPRLDKGPAPRLGKGPAPRPGVMEIEAYAGGASSVAGQDRVIKLSSNEGAFGPSAKAVAAARAAAETMHRYPDGSASAVREAIAKAHTLDASRIICGAGSDELISLLCYTYAGAGDEVIYTEHGFLMYPIAAKAAGATPVAVPEADLTADVDAILGAVTKKTRIVFLANPNNPTGTYLGRSEMARLRDGLRADILLVIDAAYAEFVDADDYDAGVELVDAGIGKNENVVMTRTFSKIYALGGLRLGWAYAPPAIADVLNRVRGPFNVSSLAQAAGVAAMEDAAFVAKCRAHTIDWRARLTQRLRGMGLAVPASQGNFLLARFPGGRDQAAAADAFLKENGIIVRAMDGYGLPDCLRISIGTDEEMDALGDTLARFMAS